MPNQNPDDELIACLPTWLREGSPTLTRLGQGLSRAGVYRVVRGEESYVLKVSDKPESEAEWLRKVGIRQAAAEAGLTPRVVHVDAERRALLCDFVADRGFPAFYGNPQTHGQAMRLLGQTLRRAHSLPLTPVPEAPTALGFLAENAAKLAGFSVPGYVTEALAAIQAETPPLPEREPVLSHNDVNPGNLLFDGEHLLLIDWENAGPNDPFYDLAAIAVFVRMDAAACKRLLAAYDGAETELTPRFDYNRRLVALLCGVTILNLARQGGHPGATGTESLADTPDLGAFYQRMMTGEIDHTSPYGQWMFGLALVKAGLTPLA